MKERRQRGETKKRWRALWKEKRKKKIDSTTKSRGRGRPKKREREREKFLSFSEKC